MKRPPPEAHPAHETRGTTDGNRGSPAVSVIIPARDEQAYIGACIDSIHIATRAGAIDTEIVVVINRCTDSTEALARTMGARVVHSEERCLAAVRNAGVAASAAPIIVTIDADSRMSANALAAVTRRLAHGRYVGGGCLIWPERWSLGIALSGLLLLPYALATRLSAGMFWCRRADFEAIGGFDESMVSVEDIDFARRLKRHGQARGQSFGTLLGASITTSCRKFDRFGDWHLLSQPRLVVALLSGKSREAANHYYYDFEH